MVHGTQADAEALREQIGEVLSTMGLRLSPEKTDHPPVIEGHDQDLLPGICLAWAASMDATVAPCSSEIAASWTEHGAVGPDRASGHAGAVARTRRQPRR
jgi:hypothetical protein